ncbi:MAG: CARDB domain-containing protein, partial [archaeon]
MIKKTLIVLAGILCIITLALPCVHAASYSISIRDTTFTPEDLSIGDTLNVKVQYRIEGPSGPDVKLYLYVDDVLEKTYTRSHSYAGTYYYTFYFDTDDLEGTKHEIKIKAKVYEGSTLKDTDTYSQNIYFDDERTGSNIYNIDIQDITITPSDAHAGDTISIRTKFSTDTPQTSKVKLYLYIDQKLETTYTGNYNSATLYHTFSYSTKDLEKGTHTAKIKTELYRDTWLKDTDTETESFSLLEKRNINHDLDITSINYNTPISTKESIPVTVTVKNSGNIDEENVKIRLILDAKTVYSAPFYLIRGQSKTITTYIDTPEKSGKYEIVIIAYNQNSEQKSIQFIETYGYTLSLAISPKEEAYVGDWIKITGYAKQDGVGTTRKIDIYKDDIYEKTIMPGENGVYTDYVRFETAQYHKITADLAGTRNDKIILIKQKETATTGTTGTAGDGAISMEVEKDKPYTIIIVKEGTERIYIEK